MYDTHMYVYVFPVVPIFSSSVVLSRCIWIAGMMALCPSYPVRWGMADLKRSTSISLCPKVVTVGIGLQSVSYDR